MCTPEQKLKQFLHYGREIPVYQPGDRSQNPLYRPQELASVDALIANEKVPEITNCIVKAFSDGYSAHPDMLVYALAFCAKQKASEALREAAYKAFKTVCATPENLFLFIFYASKIPDTSLWGTGCRKVLKEWYLKKDVKALAEIVSRVKRRHAWSHKDVMKLIHLKVEKEPAREAIVKYVLHGFKTAKKEFADKPEAAEVLSHLQVIEDFKHMTDVQQAARVIETHKLTLDHIPKQFIKSKEIWASLVGNLPLSVLITNLERIGYLGFLKPKSPVLSKVLDALSQETSIADSHLHPAQVYIALRKYETSSKFAAAENAQKKKKPENGSGEAKRVVRVPPKANPKIVAAMYEVFASTCKLLAPTGMKYMVAIDLRSFIPTEKCHRCSYVSPPQAAAVTTLCLLHADQNVVVKVQSPPEVLVPVDLNTTMTVQQAIDKLKETSMHRLAMATPLKWAISKKEKYDVIVLITDALMKSNSSANTAELLRQYREEMSVPNIKFITLSLKCHYEPTWAVDSKDPGMLDICGFDGNVPRIIEAFSRGAF